jgi:phosphoribosylformylglycinamidine synthase II
MSVASPAVALEPGEMEEVRRRLGREPNALELGMLEALWSEHCSYKTSRRLLRRLPSEGGGVLAGPGHNAGVVEIGEGWAVAFKVESHNHPSAVEPYQGASTGVGGILRDVIAMGARPVALLDSLRFGPLPASRRHLEGVVAGVGGYGNCVGVPTVGGELWFDESCQGNPLVNVMCVGLLRTGTLSRPASRAGDLLLLAGAATGRDGIRGAAFASAQLEADAFGQRPAVQVGNPFFGKCLLEACMELLEVEGVVGLQDLGAAGLTSAVAEAAARFGLGARVDVARVPRRDGGMDAAEVMLAESQERMLVLARPDALEQVAAILARWELPWAVVGEFVGDGRLTVVEADECRGELPVELLTEAPERRPAAAAPPAAERQPLPRPVADRGTVLLQLLASPNLASRRPVFRRYDHMVGCATVVPPGGDGAVLRVLGTSLGIAVAIDSNRYGHLDPYVGAQLALAEACRNVVACGARPLAATDCLNLADPDRPEVAWQLERTVEGLADACRQLGLPIVSGNVSLYNESPQGAIAPTPVVGVVGLLPDHRRALGIAFGAGDLVLLAGRSGEDWGGSEFLRLIEHRLGDRPPSLDLALEAAMHRFLLGAAAEGLLTSAHDLAQGGLAVALAECCLAAGLGVSCGRLDPEPGVSLEALWFGESPSRFLVGARPQAVPALQVLAARHGVELRVLGPAGGDELELGGVRLPLERLRQAWESGLEKVLEHG